MSDQEDPDVATSSLVCSCIAYVCGLKRVGSRIAGGGSVMQKGQFNSSIEPEWTGVRIHESKATTSSKDFKLKE